jgi:hypothetical protein
MLRSIVAGALDRGAARTASAVNLGVMGLARVPLDIVTAPIACDGRRRSARTYAIYFISASARSSDVSQTPHCALLQRTSHGGKAIVYVRRRSRADISCCAFRGSSYHAELGILVALAMVVSSAASITLLHALLLNRTAAVPVFGPRLTDIVPRPHNGWSSTSPTTPRSAPIPYPGRTVA